MADRYTLQYMTRFLACVLAACLLTVTNVQAQELPAFEVDAVCAQGDGTPAQTRLDLYTKVPFANLRFLNTSKGFSAKYTVTAELYALNERGRRQNLAQTRIWDRAVQVENFAATQSDQLFDLTTQSLTLPPGRYLVVFQLEDHASGETFVQEHPARVRSLEGPVALSDLILLDDYDAQSNTISPRVAPRLSTDARDLQFFYELYANGGEQAVQITQELIRTRKSNGPPSVRTLFGLGQEENEDGEVVYAKTEARTLKKGRTPMVSTIPLEEVQVGAYVVRVTVQGKDGRSFGTATKGVSAHWTGLAAHIRDLDDAIAQLQYIAKDRELKRIKDTPTLQERLQRFREFWEKRDPTPGTQRNERMEEYYYRVAFANSKYGSLIDGWKTDRGLVYVKFGEPDFVESHPYSFNADPYEIWFYYRIGKRFIFIDKTGFGNYELLVPIWDERTRIR